MKNLRLGKWHRCQPTVVRAANADLIPREPLPGRHEIRSPVTDLA